MKHHIDISIQTLYSVEAPLTGITTLSLFGYDARSFEHLDLRIFGDFFSADPVKLCQVGWGSSIDSYFQVTPEMFNRIQVRALAGPIKDIHRVVHQPLLHCLGCVLKVIVLLEGEPSSPSEVLSTLD